MAFDKSLRVCSMSFHVFHLMHFLEGTPTIYTFGKSCSLEPLQVNEDSTYYLSFYNAGKPSDLWCSHIAFSGQGSNSRDLFKLCTAPTRFSDPTCKLRLTLRNSLNGTVLKTFTCTDHAMSKFCMKEGENLYFVMEFGEIDKWFPSNFLFIVDATKTYDHMEMIAGISGGSIALFVITIAAIVTCVKCLKMHMNNTQVLSERFRNITGVFPCQNSSRVYRSNLSSIPMNLEASERTCEVTSVGRPSRPVSHAFSNPHVVSHDTCMSTVTSSTYVDPNSIFAIYNPRRPPPYQEEDNQSFDPPPDYFSVTS